MKKGSKERQIQPSLEKHFQTKTQGRSSLESSSCSWSCHSSRQPRSISRRSMDSESFSGWAGRTVSPSQATMMAISSTSSTSQSIMSSLKELRQINNKTLWISTAIGMARTPMSPQRDGLHSSDFSLQLPPSKDQSHLGLCSGSTSQTTPGMEGWEPSKRSHGQRNRLKKELMRVRSTSGLRTTHVQALEYQTTASGATKR